LHSIRSLVFITNPVNQQLDLLAADNAGGEIVRYCADFNTAATPAGLTTGTVIFSQTLGVGPTNPDGLSVDSAGNLFVVNQGSGTSTHPQLWVFPAPVNPAPGACQNFAFQTPVLIDSASYQPNPKETLEETLVAGTTVPLPTGAAVAQINPGDLLVLTSNPPTVLIYPGSNGHGPSGLESPKTLINLPVGTQPGGMAFWPVDNSLLVTNSTGTILQYPVANILPNGTPGTFASGLGNGQFKVKTGRQGGNVYAFVANNNGGDILELNPSGQVISTVTTNVQHPQGLAVSNAAYAPFTCASGCSLDLLKGQVVNGVEFPLLTHQLTAPTSGNIIEDVCVVPTDPRIAQYGSCTLAASAPKSPYANGLPVALVCGAGFDNSANPLVIPNSMCGASGSNSSGFALIRTLTQAGAGFPYNGTYVESDTQFSGLAPGPNDPVCSAPVGNPPPPFAVAAWAPLKGEGVSPAGNLLLDIANGCDTGGGTGRLSLWAVGLDLNTSAIPGGLVGFATTEYTTLLNTVTAESTAGVLTPPPSGGPPPNFAFQLQQCIQTSQGAFLKGSANYPGAAQELLVADYNVYSNATLTPPFTPSNDYPNPSGLLRSLLETTRFTVGVRLAGGDATVPAFPPVPSTTTPVNITPTVTGTPNPSATVGHKYSYDPATADFAGNTSTLTYSLTGAPPWLTLFVDKKNNQLLLSGTPPAPGGPYNVTLAVSDGCATNVPTAASSWTITVTP
jgi:hypothetical protein